MLHSTKGIVFHSLKYSESGVIVKIYTELFGIQSYLVKGVRKANARIRPGLFQPLTLLDLVVYHKEKASLQSVREAHLAFPYRTIPFDIRKSAVAMFINELVYKSIREEEPNPELFEFLWSSLLRLDETTEPVPDFHLFFALRFCRFLGIFPQLNYSPQAQVFNLREGIFQSSVPDHPHYLDPGNSKIFFDLAAGVQNTEQPPHTEPTQNKPMPVHPDAGSRRRLLEILLIYYRLHLPGFKGVQSHLILHDVLA